MASTRRRRSKGRSGMVSRSGSQASRSDRLCGGRAVGARREGGGGRRVASERRGGAASGIKELRLREC